MSGAGDTPRSVRSRESWLVTVKRTLLEWLALSLFRMSTADLTSLGLQLGFSPKDIHEALGALESAGSVHLRPQSPGQPRGYELDPDRVLDIVDELIAAGTLHERAAPFLRFTPNFRYDAGQLDAMRGIRLTWLTGDEGYTERFRGRKLRVTDRLAMFWPKPTRRQLDQLAEGYLDEVVGLCHLAAFQQWLPPGAAADADMPRRNEVLIASESFLQGRMPGPDDVPPHGSWFGQGLHAIGAQLRGEDPRALFRNAAAFLGDRREHLPMPFALFQAVALLREGSDESLEWLEALTRQESAEAVAIETISVLQELTPELPDIGYIRELGPWARLFWATAVGWTERAMYRETALEELDLLEAMAVVAELAWPAAQCQAVRTWLQSGPGSKPGPAAPGTLPALYAPPPRWERSLGAAARLLETSEESSREERLVFVITRGSTVVETKIQKRKASGGWTSGRLVRISSFRPRPPIPLTPADQAVLAYVKLGHVYNSDWVLPPEGIAALDGHPRVMWDTDLKRTVEVKAVPPHVHLEQNDDGLKFRISAFSKGFVDAVTHAEICVFEERVEEAFKLLDEVTVPADGIKTAMAMLQSLEGIALVTSDLKENGDLPELAGDPRIRVRLQREKGTKGEIGLSFRCLVVPHPAASEFVAGEGAERIVTRKAVVVRDLDAEKTNLAALHAKCPTMNHSLGEEVKSLEKALDLLAELRDAGARVEWPKGKKLSLVPDGEQRVVLNMERNGNNLFRSKDQGGLEIDAQVVASLQELLFARRSGSRYVAVGNDQFVRLEQSAREALGVIEAFEEEEVVHPLIALAQQKGLTLVGDPQFEQQCAALLAAGEKSTEIPAGLNAELRGYQVAGYKWLARLGHMGLGAILADDMGLGKTIQTLTLLLSRCEDGPALVVAPTSLLTNWARESARFTPALKCVRLAAGGSAKARKKALTDAGPGTVVLTTYGLMQRQAALFAEKKWHTVVLDEAQAIKNPDSLRAKAAFQLNADFRVALSGTPVENKALELWSLMKFLVPGLLGTKKSFEASHSTAAAAGQGYEVVGLRARVQPFLLRRTKSEVLPELPPRTDVAIEVEPGKKQGALIELLRQEAEKACRGESHMEIFAALMKLRQACCHPSLVSPHGNIPSAKMEAFRELVSELKEGGHRVLVFSQFSGHLALVRAELEHLGLTYQYLDGKTPPKTRQKRVDAFQAGEGDVFLISLKAGGTGLNLTAADYVVHLDPWWNPAVEDQASDRAHRIGQTRPVTVYRIVIANSIESQILAMHEKKRDLAERLLSGSQSVKLDPESLLVLLAGGSV